MRLTALLLAALLVFTSAPSAPAAPPLGKPNILWLVSEDNDTLLGCYGDKMAHTPTIDRLAKEGVLYERCFTNPVCAPSRFTLITGTFAATAGPAQHMRAQGRIKLVEVVNGRADTAGPERPQLGGVGPGAIGVDYQTESVVANYLCHVGGLLPAGADDQVTHGARQQDLVRVGAAADPRRDVYRYATDVGIEQFAFAGVDASADLDV